MNEKYLPIGSIITTKKSSQKIMIVGYFGLEYTEAIEVYDYMGCTYPKGLLEKNNMIFFNHEDIITCDFMGYKDSSYTDLNKKLIGEDVITESLEELTEEEMLEPIPSNIVFDDDLLKIVEDDKENKEKTSNNVSVFDESKEESTPSKLEVEPEEKTTNNEEFKIPHYRFDENGIIITEEDN